MDEVLHPGEVGVAARWKAELPACVVFFAEPVGVVEGRMAGRRASSWAAVSACRHFPLSFVDMYLSGLIVQILLEASKYLSDLFRLAQVGYGVRDGVVVFEPQ
jgi:hypothetical protein